MHYSYITYSNKGKRQRNEDSYFPKNGTNHNNLFFVCDGIGGHGDGDLASAFITDYLPAQLSQNQSFSEEILVDSFKNTHTDLKRYAMQVGNLQMGSTIALIKLNSTKGWVGWVGDSRIYHIRNGQVLFKSKDHSLFELMLDNGKLSAEEADNYSMKHIIYQALGTHGTAMNPSVAELKDIQEKDIFLLASDGLFEAWSEEELVDLLKNDSQASAKILYERCLQNSNDNFTFTIVKAVSA